MKKGNIIFLNGVSSSGKTTLAKALQKHLPEPYFWLSVDTFCNMAPEPNLENFIQAWTGMSHSIRAFSEAGIHTIVDHVLLRNLDAILAELLTELHDCPVLFVHVTCPLEELRRREKARGDREIGQGEEQLPDLIPQNAYDLTIDTHTMNQEKCIAEILLFLEKPEKWTTFHSLWEELERSRKFKSTN